MADLGYDWAGVEDFTEDFADSSGRLCLAEAIARRYITDRGTLIDAPNYGRNFAVYVNDDLGASDFGEIEAEAVAEALKDERVLGVVVVASLDNTGRLLLDVTLTDADGPFRFVLAVDAVTIELLKAPQ